MEYKGNLYGRAGNFYFPLVNTTDDVEAMKEFIEAIALYKLNSDGQRELTAIKLSDFEKLKELYNKIKF